MRSSSPDAAEADEPEHRVRRRAGPAAGHAGVPRAVPRETAAPQRRRGGLAMRVAQSFRRCLVYFTSSSDSPRLRTEHTDAAKRRPNGSTARGCGGRDLPGGGEEQRHGVLGDRPRDGRRGVGDHDAEPSRESGRRAAQITQAPLRRCFSFVIFRTKCNK